jgi:DNA-binding CsgD family transcriptional regulator
MDLDSERFGAILQSLGLTEREAQVTVRVVCGRLDEEIAIELGISRSAVNEFGRRARKKLGVANQASLAAAAIRECFRGGGVGRFGK